MSGLPRKLNHVVIVPCSGIGKTYGTVSREDILSTMWWKNFAQTGRNW